MKLKKMAPIVLAAVLLISAFVFSARALPEDESGTSAVETQPPVSSQEPETQPPPEPTAPPYSEPEPQPEPSSSQEPEYTGPPAASSQTQAPDSSEEETQGQKSWLDIFKLPTEPTNEDASIPEKKDTQTTTTQYVVMGILLWVLIACGTLVTLGVLASTHRRKHGK